MLKADITDPRSALPAPTLREAIGIRRLWLAMLGDRARELQQIDPKLSDEGAMILACHAFSHSERTLRAMYDLAVAVIDTAEGRRPSRTVRRVPAATIEPPAGR